MSIAGIAERYVNTRPYAKQALRHDIANYSKLARCIAMESNCQNIPAILVALRRYSLRLRRQRLEANISAILKKTSLVVRDKVVVAILQPDARFENLLSLQRQSLEKKETIHIVRGISAITLIMAEDLLVQAKKMLLHDILKLSGNLVEIVMKSPVSLETVPGVMGYVYSLFAENNVNILETMSCWTDTIFVIRKGDLSRTMDFLSF